MSSWKSLNSPCTSRFRTTFIVQSFNAPQSGPPRQFERGLVRTSCLYWPLTSSHELSFSLSMPNSRHVSSKAGRQSSRFAWSTVGRRWCSPCEPKFVNTRNNESSITLRSRTASNSIRPQSTSSLKCSREYYNSFGREVAILQYSDWPILSNTKAPSPLEMP